MRKQLIFLSTSNNCSFLGFNLIKRLEKFKDQTFNHGATILVEPLLVARLWMLLLLSIVLCVTLSLADTDCRRAEVIDPTFYRLH